MLPENRLSSEVNAGNFLSAGLQNSSRTVDYEDGPIDLDDSSEGLFYQIWKARIVGNDAFLSAPNFEEVLFLSGIALTDISIAFNQNGRLHYAYVDQNELKLNWYDSISGSFTTTNFGNNFRNPKLTMDDKRPESSGQSDIILAYLRNSDNALCHRRQRDRFQTEYVLNIGPFISLEKMYFNDRNCLQFSLVSGDPNA